MNYDQMAEVNEAVNEKPYTADAEQYGKSDFWEALTDTGDCEDYALAKYQALVAAGFSPNELRLACCYTESGEYHAVLLVDLDGATWVLDNRQPHPTQYALLPYKWDKLQVAGTPRWERA